VANLWNSPLHRPQPNISEHTNPESTWTIPISTKTVDDDDEMEGIKNSNLPISFSRQSPILIQIIGYT
jgi:hypothetical protein